MERRNDIPNLLAMSTKLYNQKSKQGCTTTGETPSKLQHNENYNQRGRQTIVQV